MARWAAPVDPNPERLARLEEADTIEALAGFRLRAYAPATWCEFGPDGWPELDADAICSEHPDHPAVVAYLENIATANEMRAEAVPA
jgi:hypothetical protein